MEAIVGKYGEDLPPFPLKGTETIIHISKVRDLWKKERNGPLRGGYVERVMSGNVYIYRILEPERATMEVERMLDGNFRIVQVKSYKNGDVSNKTLLLLKDWLGVDKCEANFSCYEMIL
jgi:hypothetical protein